MTRAIAFVILLLLTLFFLWAFAPLHFIWVTCVALFKREEYALNAFIGYDQTFNAVLAPVLNRLFKDPMIAFGDPDNTISGTIGENLRDWPDRSHKAMTVINKWLTAIDPHSKNHCVDSIEKKCDHL